jgi:Transcriptional regulatory protein, C terminal
VQNRDRVVSKGDLIAAVWDGRIVSDSTIATRINVARKAIGDSGQAQRLTRTVPRKGIRFVGDVRTNPEGSEPTHGAGPTLNGSQEPSRLALPPSDRPAIAREAIRQRFDFAGARRVLTAAAAAMAGEIELAKTALQELRRVQPNISLAWIASQVPLAQEAEREHYLEAFRRAGLE